MPEPIKLVVQKKLTSHLETIPELTGNVFRGKIRFSESDPLPRLTILEAPEQEIPGFSEGTPITKGTWELYIQGFVKASDDHPTDAAHDLLAKVQSKIIEYTEFSSAQTKMKSDSGKDLIYDLQLGRGICRSQDSSSSEAYFLQKVIFKLIEDVENPYV